jgi:DNA replication protein DnaC
MEQIKANLKLVTDKLSAADLPNLTLPDGVLESPKYLCNECQDSGRVHGEAPAIEGKFAGRMYKTVRDCICRLEKLRQKRLSKIPPRFRELELLKIKPMSNIHSLQKTFIPQIQANPSGNYFLAGRTGTGKSMLMWSLYREAVMNDQKVVAKTLTELIGEYHKFIQLSVSKQTLVYPSLSAEDLRQSHTKYSIFLDDIDKAKPTEYAMEQLFEIANAIYDFQHQIVVTTNLSMQKLIAHFERADERFGGAIVRRLVESSVLCDMF